jgi:NADPH:quinone reductase-like Zn-dependent oxidoreductase
MKAIVQQGYGSPDVLRLLDIEMPEIGDNGVLVKVRAASVNALDWHTTRGMPYLMRIDEGLRTPRHNVRGVDLAGRVVSAGRNVTRFKPGDDVFGGGSGSFAEYVATTGERLASKPPGLTYEQAAALHVAGLTALQGLRDRAGVERGQSVLVNGAGGGVGIFAVQIARWLGAHVTAVTRTESIDIVRSIGADEVVDHQVEDFTRRNQRYDVVFDIGGSRPLWQCRRVMARRGILVVVGGPAGRWLAPASRMLKAFALSPFVSQRFVPFLSTDDHRSLAVLAGLAETGKISPVIDRRYDLAETPEAIRYVGEGHPRGKVVIEVR